MVELTQELRDALRGDPSSPIRLVDPRTNETFVLLRAEEYDRLAAVEVDASPWTKVEMDLLAQESADQLGWEGMEAYQDESP